jgi:NAD(P)H dehydrogenase (quinone)
MGSASAQMKQFMDATSKAWFTDAWKDKIAAGFTNSGSLAGDKSSTLAQFATLAAQQGMVWVNFGMKSGFNASGHDFASAQNRAGFYNGLATQAMTDLSAEEGPDAADLKTAELFGERVANATLRWVRGAA